MLGPAFAGWPSLGMLRAGRRVVSRFNAMSGQRERLELAY
jgi:hypothetical protein